MRTTIEMSDKLRAKLLAYSALKGKRGFSEIVCEAVEEYLSKKEGIGDRVDNFRKLRGILTDEEAKEAKKIISEMWESWKVKS
ncbi:MAG: hypothetical protein M1371_07065 [Actinobacteria bacterium]|nr:hypothetical protein [Actinomycetota bacterium]